MNTYNDLPEKKKVAYYLTLSKEAISILSQDKDQKKAQTVLNKCWKWYDSGNIRGDDLYSLLDVSDEGIIHSEERASIKSDKFAWACLIDALAYTCRKAYEQEGVVYFPEDIELVDDDLLEQFNDNFRKTRLDRPDRTITKVLESLLS